MNITVIEPEIHLLPGIGQISYNYDNKQKELSILIDGEQFRSFNGIEAKEYYNRVIVDLANEDELVNKLNSMIKSTWGKDFNINVLKSKSREREIVVKRQICMWYLNKHQSMKLKSIGNLFGGFDYATVLHAKRTIDDLNEFDKEIQKDVKKFLRYE